MPDLYLRILPTYYLTIYSILWGVFFLFLLLKRKEVLSIPNLFVGLFFLNALISIWIINNPYYTTANIYRGFRIESFTPLLYLFLALLMWATPLFSIKKDSIQSVYLYSQNSPNLIKKFLFYGIIAIYVIAALFVFLASISQIGNISMLYSSDSVSKKIIQAEYIYTICSKNTITKYSYHVYNAFSDSMIVISFFFLSRKRKIVGLLLFVVTIVSQILLGVIAINRQILICVLLTILITSILFKNVLDGKIKKILFGSFLIFAIGLFVPVVLISFLRFGSNINYTLWTMFRYLGESPINFASEIWFHQNELLLSKYSFNVFWGKSIAQRITEAQHIAGISGDLFYTYIGDLIIDFGRITIFTIGILICIYFFRKKISKNISLASLIFLQTWCIMSIEGVFLFFHCLTPTKLIVPFIFYFILNVSLKKHEIPLRFDQHRKR